MTEEKRAAVINRITGLEGEHALKGSQVIECHTPLGAPEYVQKYKDKFILVSGMGEMVAVANHYGYKKVLDITEFYAIVPECVHFLKYGYYGDYTSIQEEKRSQVLSRLGYQSVQSLRDDLVFGALMSWSDPLNLELNLQVFSDILISKDGRIDGPSRSKGDP